MKVAWFTPFSTRSAIGEFSRHVTDVLARHTEVEIWTPDVTDLQPTELPVIGFAADAIDVRFVAERDIAVYNMGDHLPFHGHIYGVSQGYPGVVILHDRVLHHLFAGMWLNSGEARRQTYVQRMGTFYGPEAAEIAAASLRGERAPVWETDEEALAYPLFEEALLHAIGAVTHSDSHARQVRARWLGPVTSLHLPCYAQVLREGERAGSARGGNGDRVQLLTIGHVNPNKQVDRVVEILAADPALAAKVHYTIAGPTDGFRGYVEDVERLVANHRPQLSVDVLGWCSDADLERLMRQADVFVNLRHPVMEGGSASLMRQLAYGRPVLCFAEGLFGEIPAGAAAHATPGDFVAVAEQLRALVADPDLRRSVGAAGRAVAERYTEERYVEGLLELIEQARSAAPALSLTDRVADELGAMGVDPGLPIYDEIIEDFGRFLHPLGSEHG